VYLYPVRPVRTCDVAWPEAGLGGGGRGRHGPAARIAFTQADI